MRFSAISLTALLTMNFLLPALQATDHNPERVLILHSYHKADWTDNIMKGINSVLSHRNNVKIYVEYMDTKEFNDPEYLKMLHDTMLQKYKNLDFDLVITSDDNAWNFAMNYSDDLFNYAPIVFCGVNRFKPELIKGKKVTGVVEEGDFKSTLDYIVKAMPKLKHLYIVCDNSKTGIINMTNLAKVMKKSFPGISVICTKDMNYLEMDKTLQNATPGEDAAFFIAFWKDSAGKAISPSELEQVFRTSKIPVFGRSEWMINRGMTGGKCVSGFNQGEVAAKLAIQILDSPEHKLPPVRLDSPNQFMFDYTELDKHNLLNSPLPNDAIVFKKPYSIERVYQDNKVFFWILCGLIVLLVIALDILIIDKIKRKRAERALKESEQKFKAIFNQTFQLTAVLDPEGKIIEVNDTLLKVFPTDRKKIMGKFLWEGPWCSTPLLTKQITQAVKDAAAGKFVRIELEETISDGSLRYTDFTLKPVFDDEGKVVMLIPEGRDITPRVKAFIALKQSEQSLNITLESIGDAVIATDAEGTIVRMNRVATELTGWKTEEAVGEKLHKVFKIIASNAGDKVEDPVSKVIKEGKITGLANDTLLISKDKTKRQIADSGAPIRNENGKIVGVVLVFRDVTEEYKIQEQLRQSQKMEAIGQLAGGVAHDFNNLLTAIMGNAQLMTMSADLKRDEVEFAEDIIKASKRASDLTSQLLAFSRKGPLQNIKVSIHEILEEMIGILSHSIDRRITINKEFTAKPDIVTGDPSQLQNAFLNLGVNARDAMPDGGELTFSTKNINIRKNDQRVISGNVSPGKFIEINVADTGNGIEKEILERIFEPFFSTKSPGQGTGLGLASVYGCIGSHDGNIKVKSKPRKGSTFTIIIPCAQAGEDRKYQNKKGITVSGKGKILVIDDEDYVRSLCAKSLSKLGYTVTTKSDGITGLDYYRKHVDQIDLIVLDLIMPNLSGEDTFTLLKEVDPKVKVLILSGFSKDQTVNQLLKNGALSFVPKPFEISILSQEVSRCLKKK